MLRCRLPVRSPGLEVSFRNFGHRDQQPVRTGFSDHNQLIFSQIDVLAEGESLQLDAETIEADDAAFFIRVDPTRTKAYLGERQHSARIGRLTGTRAYHLGVGQMVCL